MGQQNGGNSKPTALILGLWAMTKRKKKLRAGETEGRPPGYASRKWLKTTILRRKMRTKTEGKAAKAKEKADGIVPAETARSPQTRAAVMEGQPKRIRSPP